MNLVRSRLSIGNFLGQRCRQIAETWSHRGMCNKPQEVKAQPPPATPAHALPREGFKIPGYKPSPLDKKVLVWSGRFKSADQIPELVSYETLHAARNRVRVKACYMMMAATIGACLLMVVLGKKAAGRHESLSGQNMEKKAKWRELQRKQEATDAVALSGKAQ